MGVRRYSATAVDTSLNGAITGAATSLVVNNPGGYPDAAFTIQVEAEIIWVGTRSGATFSGLIRGFDGTVAAAHGNGAVVEHVATADDFDWRWTDVRLDRPHGVIDEEFSGTSLANFPTQLVVTGTTTWTEGSGVMSAKFASQSANDCNALLKSLGPLAAPPIEVTSATRWLGAADNFMMAGPLLSNGTTSTNTTVWSMLYTDASHLIYASVRSGTFTNISTDHNSSPNVSQFRGPWMYQKVTWLSTNSFSFGFSCDGVSWLTYGPYTITLTPTHVGLGVSTWGSASTKLATFEYLRVKEI